ncbi:MAG: diguanylate cyclase [Acidobacteriaceae bacterium]|jgi:diguanylate cyclase (GGDEF)-like protein
MSLGRTFLPPEPDEDIEQCLEQPWYRIHFPARVERKFELGTSKIHRAQLSVGLLLFAAAHLALLLADSQAGRLELQNGLKARVAVVLPVCLLGVALLRFDLPGWARGLVAGIPVVVAMLADSWMALHVSPRFIDIYFVALLLETFASNLILPLRVQHAALVTAACIAIYLGVLFGILGYVPPLQSRNMDACLSILALVSFSVRWNNELRDRRTFLLTARDRVHTQQLAWANRQLKELSYTDSLTGIPNRRYFNEVLQRSWNAAVAAGDSLGVLMIDVDRFKRYNDTLGHGAGDKCLCRIARALQFSVRVEMDSVARWGGEEFVAILPKASLEDTARVGERVRQAVEELQIAHPTNPEGAFVTVSVGIVCCGHPSVTMAPDVLLRAADRALYLAKSQGRNRVAEGTVGAAIAVMEHEGELVSPS